MQKFWDYKTPGRREQRFRTRAQGVVVRRDKVSFLYKVARWALVSVITAACLGYAALFAFMTQSLWQTYHERPDLRPWLGLVFLLSLGGLAVLVGVVLVALRVSARPVLEGLGALVAMVKRWLPPLPSRKHALAIQQTDMRN
jgi:hypothetical protein